MDIYAGVVTNLGLKKRSRDITEFLKNIKGTIEDDDWDQVIIWLFHLIIKFLIKKITV